ncbi:SBBP repeat-containing protein [Laspinema olomoucense]|uniref:SBBP repeat-containing protein n=1 Tax=Laspinema olomoucense D3b TaxID=2953688 RepID=A0ABT2N4Z7_9CYAN|nr:MULTISPECIES: SBBP repeat-containing protein [unclassified Laspinema]MCT7976949.1 SBBP repeat-containing protein [Laspinema sp. D3b]MCT7989585.1 SBBP repeat-containing protein [Laspinema sp. D3a]
MQNKMDVEGLEIEWRSPLEPSSLVNASGLWPLSTEAAGTGFDAEFYLNAYPDVAQAVGTGEFESGWQHWLLYGQPEGRLPVSGAMPQAIAPGESVSPEDPPGDPLIGEQVPNLSQLPLSFIPNAGQFDPTVNFSVRGASHAIFFTPDEVVFTAAAQPDPESDEVQSSVVRLEFVGANGNPVIEGIEPLPGLANFLSGSDGSTWSGNVPTYQGIAYRDLYDGIDLVYRGTEGALKREFVVDPGADPGQIRLDYSGIEAVALREGALVLQTALGELIEGAPIIYQDIEGSRVAVAGEYELLGDGQVGFELGAYDPNYALIIDPTLQYSSYLGGTLQDQGDAIALDAQGNIYIAGRTISTDFPTRIPLQSTISNPESFKFDAFITKIAPDGASAFYSTYLGGRDNDRALDVAIDSRGSAFVVGQTSSDNFPVTVGAAQTAFNGETDGFIVKLTANGGFIETGTYFGGAGSDSVNSITLDNEGNFYVTGQTFSENFPMQGAVQNTIGANGSDVLVAKFNPLGGLLYSTFLGGFGNDVGQAIAVDGNQNIYVTGQASSDNFPLVSELQRRYRGGGDAFVTKISSDGSQLIYSTYLGGRDSDIGNAIAVDAAGHVYIAGSTGVPRDGQPGAVIPVGDFPKVNPLQAQLNGLSEAFVTKLAPDGKSLIYSTFLGGSGFEEGNDMAIDNRGNVYLTGETTSSDLPQVAPIQPGFGGNGDAFVGKILADGRTIDYLTYLGGNGFESGNAIAVNPVGTAFVTGQSASANFATVNPLPNAAGGVQGDAFVVAIAQPINPTQPIVVPVGAPAPDPGSLPGPGGAEPFPPAPAPTEPPAPPPPPPRFENFIQSVTERGLNPLTLYFNEAAYLAQNPGVAEAVAAGNLPSGLEHYLRFGRDEGRPAATQFFNEGEYLAQNPDVALAVGTGQIGSGFEHFVQTGFFEGRDRNAKLFLESFYLRQNPDVAEAVAAGIFNSGYSHYLQSGQFERRNPNPAFDETFYLTQNPDVAAIVAAGGFVSGFQHFLEQGEIQGRSPSPLFSESAYLFRNIDVARALSRGAFSSAFEHFVLFGLQEGRVATP